MVEALRLERGCSCSDHQAFKAAGQHGGRRADQAPVPDAGDSLRGNSDSILEYTNINYLLFQIKIEPR